MLGYEKAMAGARNESRVDSAHVAFRFFACPHLRQDMIKLSEAEYVPAEIRRDLYALAARALQGYSSENIATSLRLISEALRLCRLAEARRLCRPDERRAG